ncbi:hypothetical protein [Saccharopolyspora shandongensis]|uniref:hypothetical protein n=1 Tax=Saccharopolyspora shandongensis TaxID=418495 RepID=UPI0033C7058E
MLLIDLGAVGVLVAESGHVVVLGFGVNAAWNIRRSKLGREIPATDSDVRAAA